LIAQVVDEKKPAQGEKGQYGYVRQAEEKPKRSRKKRVKNTERPPANVDQYAAVEGLVGLPTMSMTGLADSVPADGRETELPDAPGPDNVATLFRSTLASPLDHTVIRKSPAEEEMDDDEGEWTVRVGDAQPPAWGKRKASEEVDNGNGNKRTRHKCVL
jgi:hypothetical protein